MTKRREAPAQLPYLWVTKQAQVLREIHGFMSTYLRAHNEGRPSAPSRSARARLTRVYLYFFFLRWNLQACRAVR
jgi:hypothetical protein